MRYRTIAPIVLILLLLLTTATGSPVPQASSDEQKITHVLNRLSFGPRPNEAERVQKLGIQAYIEQQLAPESIDDSRADDKTSHLASLRMSTEEIFEKYPDAQQLARQLGIRTPRQNQDGAT